MVTVADVRAVASRLPRSYEVLVRGRIKFRVGQIVYVAFSRDETLMGFGFPKSEREYLVSSEPEKYQMPGESDLRFHWVVAQMAALDEPEMRERVVEAWAMVAPRFLHPEGIKLLDDWDPGPPGRA